MLRRQTLNADTVGQGESQAGVMIFHALHGGETGRAVHRDGWGDQFAAPVGELVVRQIMGFTEGGLALPGLVPAGNPLLPMGLLFGADSEVVHG